MEASEADKIIAEFMGYTYESPCYWFDESGKANTVIYSKSLDALVPVFKKLDGMLQVVIEPYGDFETVSIFYYSTKTDRVESVDSSAKSIQEAAAIATAKAIKELKNE